MQNNKDINTPVLVWITNNQRLHDNAVLNAAIQSGKQVLALYCFDKTPFETHQFGFRKIEKYRAKFLTESIKELKASFRKHHITLLTYFDTPKHCIAKVCAEYDIEEVYVQKEWTREECQTLASVKAAVGAKVIFHEIYDQFLFHPHDIPIGVEEIPEVFTVFRKICERQSKVLPAFIYLALPQENRVPDTTTIPSLATLGYSDFDQPTKSAFPFSGGESSATARLHDYFFTTKKLGFYKKTRNGLMGTDYSSKFSPWLAHGNISARTIYHQVKLFESTHYKNQSTYWLIFELIWRDYFKYIALKHGNALFLQGGIKNRTYTWHKNQKAIQQWIDGTTSEPFVNANMIELKETGWMSNRGRQNVASYFAKTLKQDWRIGAAYFESLLIDYDVHSNYGNWQYVAGVGNDPRDRVFNVKLQAQRYDTNNKYQRMWLQKELFK